MRDSELQELKRRWQESQNYSDHFVYRNALIRAGRAAEAGLEIGDVCSITEVETPWIEGPWEGEIKRIFKAGDMHVSPLDINKVTFRVKPSPEDFKEGVYLTRSDKRTLLEPVLPERYQELAEERRRNAELDAEQQKYQSEAQKNAS